MREIKKIEIFLIDINFKVARVSFDTPNLKPPSNSQGWKEIEEWRVSSGSVELERFVDLPCSTMCEILIVDWLSSTTKYVKRLMFLKIVLIST